MLFVELRDLVDQLLLASPCACRKHDIAIVLRDEDVNIDGCLLQALVDGRSEMEMVVQVRDVAHLYHVIDRLRHLPSVMEVLRKTANEE